MIVKESPTFGLKPFIRLTLRVPLSVALPLTARRSYWVPTVVPPISMGMLLVDPWARSPVMVKTPTCVIGESGTIEPLFVKVMPEAIMPFPIRMPPDAFVNAPAVTLKVLPLAMLIAWVFVKLGLVPD